MSALGLATVSSCPVCHPGKQRISRQEGRTLPKAEAERAHREGGVGMPLVIDTVEELLSWDSGSLSGIHGGSGLLHPVVIFGDVGEGEI